MARNMEKGSITTILGANIKVNGSMIGNTATGSYSMQTGTSMKDIGKMGREMVKVCTNTQTVIAMKANGPMI